MSLIGQLPLAAIWFDCKNVEESKRFYKDLIGLKLMEESNGGIEKRSSDDAVHFDLGTIRLSLLPRATIPKGEKNGGSVQVKNGTSDHLVFVIENSIDAVQADLIKRGVKMKSKRIVENSIGKTTWFNDPDGHVIYLWQPPNRESKSFGEVQRLVNHYESVSRAVADLRAMDDEVLEAEEKRKRPS